MDSLSEKKLQAQQFLRDNQLVRAKQLYGEVCAANAGDIESLASLGSVCGMLGQYTEAEYIFRRLLAQAPGMLGAHIGLANALMSQGNTQEAEAIYRNVIRLKPDVAQAHNNLGNLLRGAGRLIEAESSYREALRYSPDYVDALNNLGALLLERRKYDEAAPLYERLRTLAPQLPQTHLGLGYCQHANKNLPAAQESFQRAIALNPDFADAHLHLGIVADDMGNQNLAISCYQKVLALQPDHVDAARRLESLYAHLVPQWHYPMMNDEERNSAYDAALRKAVGGDSLVLDIGTGAGLLAMMAARAGARHVVTCEGSETISRKAGEIVRRNGLADKITVVNKRSTALEIGRDLPEKADVLVSEILDVGLLGEQVVPVVRHARANLVKPSATIIPRAATVYAALVESESLYKNYRVSMAAGFDVSPFNEFSKKIYFQQRLIDFQHQLLSGPFDVFDFDFCGPDIQNSSRYIEVPIRESGMCHAVVFWFRLFLDDAIYLDTGPDNKQTCWMQAIQIIDHPPRLKSGDRVPIEAKHDCTSIVFKLLPA